MKRYIVYRVSVMLLILLDTGMHAKAQRSGFFLKDRKTFYGGVVGGMNISTVDGDTYGGYHKVGVNAGGVVYTQLSNRLGFSTSLLYTQKGSRGIHVRESYYVGTFVEKYYLDLNYVEVPVVLHLFYNAKWHFGVGGAYGRLISSKEDIATDQPVVLDPATYYFRKDDISYVLQAGYQLGKNMFFDMRYESSVRTVRDRDRIPVGLGYGNLQYNRLFSIRLMYLLKSRDY